MPGNALDRLLTRKGKTRSDFSRKSKIGKIFRDKGVANTPELQRVLELPSYGWQEDEDLPQVAAWIKEQYGKPPQLACRRKCGHQEWTKACEECERAAQACPCGGEGDMFLRNLQTAALMTIHDYGGLLGPIRVGGGKTLISFLAPMLLGVERAMLVIPAKLRNKTRREFDRLRRHWHGPVRLHVMSYELLARDRGVKELEAFRPDLVIADEAHRFSSTRAACTKRMRRYLQEHNPDAKYVDMSGTITKRSIMEFYHRQNWALKDGLQPLPRKYNEARDWADAIDEKVSPTGRLMPGGLYQLCTDEELKESARDPRKSTQVRIVRQAFQRRLMTTPGVIGTTEMFDGAMAINLSAVSWEVGSEVREAFEGLRDRWELPDGHPIDEPAQLWAAARCLVQGFYYRWDPLPPPEWLMWRKEWGRTVREVLKNYRDIDSPLGVVREVLAGRIPWAKNTLEEWSQIRPTFKPQTKAFWIDDGAFAFCQKWAKTNAGIIWVNEVALGERLHKEAGLPYYGSQGLCNGKAIEDETRACVASIKANGEGRNLQQFHKNLVAAPPPGGATWEQMLGRTHRDGQRADEVNVEVVMGCYENWKVMMQALQDAKYAEHTTGQYQKLNFADSDLPGPEVVEELSNDGDPLWSKANADFFKDREDWSVAEEQNSTLTVAERAAKRKEAYAGLQG